MPIWGSGADAHVMRSQGGVISRSTQAADGSGTVHCIGLIGPPAHDEFELSSQHLTSNLMYLLDFYLVFFSSYSYPADIRNEPYAFFFCPTNTYGRPGAPADVIALLMPCPRSVRANLD